MDVSTVKLRAAARDQARVAAGLVVEEAGRIHAEAQAAFWDELKRILPLPIPPAPAPQPLAPFTDHQAKAFGRSKMPFGKHAGEPVDEVPLDYLEKLCDPQPFIKSLKRYCASTRIALKRGNDEESPGIFSEGI